MPADDGDGDDGDDDDYGGDGEDDDGDDGDHQMADSLSLVAFKEQLTIEVVRPFDLKKRNIEMFANIFLVEMSQV